MKTKNLFTKLAIIAAFALPQVSLAQTGNPRGIYKLMSIENSQATVTDYLDQYKVCTDSTTLNIFIDAASHFFGIYKNKIYDYTGDTPATPEDKSDLIYDSDLQHFTLKWWVPEQPARQEQPPVFIPNEWCIEKYQKGLFSDDGKIVFDALTQLPQADKENPLIGTWRNIGGIHSLDEEEVARLKKGYPNSEIYYNKSFYVFTPTHWLLTNDGDKGLYNKITYINHDTISDNVSVAPIPLVWLSDDCVALTITNPNNNRVYIVLERVQDRLPVLNRMAYWFVTRDVNWHLQQADAGNHIIQFQVGRAYISGTDVAQDIPKGLDYITKSAEGDFIPAQITLGLSYLRGTYVEQDPAKGFSWLYKAAEQNDPSAQFMVGACYNDGNGVEKNDAEAFKWFERSANQGYAEAQLATGLMYVTGTGIEKDDTLAMLWFQKAADQGHAKAQDHLARMYMNAEGDKRNPQKAFELFQKAAEAGYPAAQNDLAWMLYTGEDVPQNLPLAFRWAQKAVEQKDPNGYGTLAEMYYKGKGVNQDKAKAFELYSKGAELNDPESMRMLAIMYKKGEATKKDKKQAAYWQKKYDEADE